MSKPIQEQIFKSRLSITYRTNITGTVQQERLPYRLLVLGRFASKAHKEAGEVPDLANRPVRSIVRGTTVNDHLRDMVPVWRVPQDPKFDALRSTIPGKVTFDEVWFSVPASAKGGAEPREYPLSGEATFTSDQKNDGNPVLKGKLSVSGSVTFKDGEAKAQDLKVRLLGLLSSPSIDPSTRKVDGIVTASVRNRPQGSSTIEAQSDAPYEVTDIPKDLVKVQPAAETDDVVDPSKASKFRVLFPEGATYAVSAERTVPFMSMNGFEPDSVVASIPELRRLLVIKDLLLQLQSTLSNRPDLRKQLKDALPPYGAADAVRDDKLKPFQELQDWATKEFPLLKIDLGSLPAPAPVTPPGSDPNAVKKEISEALTAAGTAVGKVDGAKTAASTKVSTAKAAATDAAQAALDALKADPTAADAKKTADDAAKAKSTAAKTEAVALADAVGTLATETAATEDAAKKLAAVARKGSSTIRAAADSLVPLASAARAAAKEAQDAAASAAAKVTNADTALQSGVSEATLRDASDAAFSVVEVEKKLKEATTAAANVKAAFDAVNTMLAPMLS